MQQRFGKMQRNKEKEGMGNVKKYKERSRQIKRSRFTNKFIDNVLESSISEDEGNVTLATVMSFFYYMTSMTDIPFVTPNKRLNMFISCGNRLIPGGNNRPYALKQTCKFYLQVFILKHL